MRRGLLAPTGPTFSSSLGPPVSADINLSWTTRCVDMAHGSRVMGMNEDATLGMPTWKQLWVSQ